MKFLKNNNYLKYLFIILFVFLFDFITKTLVLKQTPFQLVFYGYHKQFYPSYFFITDITKFFNIVLVWNTGVSFSMFANTGIIGRWFLVVMAIIIACYIIYLMVKEQNNFIKICYSLIIGGAIGNIFDRIRYGAVVDFLDVYIDTYHWPAFNIADSFICIGVFLLIIYNIKNGKK